MAFDRASAVAALKALLPLKKAIEIVTGNPVYENKALGKYAMLYACLSSLSHMDEDKLNQIQHKVKLPDLDIAVALFSSTAWYLPSFSKKKGELFAGVKGDKDFNEVLASQAEAWGFAPYGADPDWSKLFKTAEAKARAMQEDFTVLLAKAEEAKATADENLDD